MTDRVILMRWYVENEFISYIDKQIHKGRLWNKNKRYFLVGKYKHIEEVEEYVKREDYWYIFLNKAIDAVNYRGPWMIESDPVSIKIYYDTFDDFRQLYPMGSSPNEGRERALRWLAYNWNDSEAGKMEEETDERN